jgi:hypothetical protein
MPDGRHALIHTGQHYDRLMSDIFLALISPLSTNRPTPEKDKPAADRGVHLGRIRAGRAGSTAVGAGVLPRV